MQDKDARLRKRRKRIYWVATLAIVAAWYVITGVESARMGLHPLVRRGFTWFDGGLYAVIILAFVGLYWWFSHCPRCRRYIRRNLAQQCPHCGFGTPEAGEDRQEGTRQERT